MELNETERNCVDMKMISISQARQGINRIARDCHDNDERYLVFKGSKPWIEIRRADVASIDFGDERHPTVADREG